ncbi:L-dopachrome tautomerase-related protein [Pseudomonas sp.]|uniref:L-dopachrome tautomerase-related protein n=1 Tax=Pseudomonas sp. TaxID=306 RepID=UPI0028AA9CA8|nr:L-dopachrome tautomerase-related protein [Pseudomonas sp.]
MKPAICLAALACSVCLGVTPYVAASTQGKPWPAFPQGQVNIEELAYFPDQQITGVAVSRSGRIFVSLPRLTVDVPVTLGEVIDGKIQPYPNKDWNGYRSLKPEQNKPASQFVSAQAVVMDHHDNLWVVDPATPHRKGPIENGVKLVKIDVNSNKVIQTLPFDSTVTPPGSSLNDVRFSPDDHYAYLSDVGTSTGAIVVMDLYTGKSWRVLEGDPSVQAEEGVHLTKDNEILLGRDGKEIKLNIDGIEISPDGDTFYWQALTGKTVYSLPTHILQDPLKAAAAKPSKAMTTHAADGLWIDAAGRFFVTNPADNSIEVAEEVGAPLKQLLKDERMRWPDSFAQDTKGDLYISASFIGDSPWFNPKATTTPSAIFKITPAKTED